MTYNGDPFDGINKLLFQKKGFDLSSHLYVEGEKYQSENWADPIHLFNPGNTNNFASVNSKENCYVLVRYKYYLIHLTNYTLRTRNGTNGEENMPKGWKLEASSDGNHWTLLHSVSKSDHLIHLNSNHTYECNNSGSFDYFKITMTETNTGTKEQMPNYHFHLSRIEFFGTLYSSGNPFLKPTCRMPIYLKFFLSLSCILI